MTLSPEEDWRHLCQMRDGVHTHTHTRHTTVHTHTHSQLERWCEHTHTQLDRWYGHTYTRHIQYTHTVSWRDSVMGYVCSTNGQHLQCALRFLETAAYPTVV